MVIDTVSKQLLVLTFKSKQCEKMVFFLLYNIDVKKFFQYIIPFCFNNILIDYYLIVIVWWMRVELQYTVFLMKLRRNFHR
jgi:hypothetical protein